MAAKREKLTEEQIHGYAQRAIETSLLFDDDGLREENTRAIDYFYGRLPDVRAEQGRSQAVSKDTSDVIGWLMPQVMRVFTSSDKLFLYEGRTPADVEAAAQATDYINYLFMEECEGYRVLYDAVHDGFLQRNGIIKHWWDGSPEYDVAEYHGINDMAVAQLTEGLEKEDILGYSEAEPVQMQQQDPQTGQVFEVDEPRYDIKIKTRVSDGRLCIEAVPPEEFLIERGARSLSDARFVAHRRRRTRSELLAMEFDREKVDLIPAYDGFVDREEELARNEQAYYGFEREILDSASEYVELFEVYIQLDANGDGISEWLQVFLGGDMGASVVLSVSEWDADLPFTPIIPDPMPHRWLGASIYDHVSDIQRQKTVIKRGALDNIYMHTNPTPVVNSQAVPDVETEEAIVTIDGSLIEVNGRPAEQLMFYQVPFIGDSALGMLEYLDREREVRTGMSQVQAGLNQDVLQNQSATAVMESSSAAHAKLELYTRNIAETGLKSLGRAIYRLVVQNQNQQQIVRLRNKYIQIDPNAWAAEMDVAVNVGLGTGSRDRDAQALVDMGAWGQNVFTLLGPNNPIFGPVQMREIGAKMAETRGLKNYEVLVGGGDGQIEAWMQQMAQQAQQDPAAQQAQAEMQAKAQKDQAELQMKQAKAQKDMELKVAEARQEIELERQRMIADQNMERDRMRAEMALEAEQMRLEVALKRDISREELQIRRETGIGSATNVTIGGQPG